MLLRKLTFDSIMDFYGKHNRTVFQRILEAQRSGTLSPFVGAGLSVPFGYKHWGGVLKELAENILDEDKKALVLGQIKDSQYEEAAGIILAEYPFMLDQLPDIVSPDILTKCSEGKKRSSAAWVLPYLFRRELVMTTNFDRCLEECYLSHQNTAIPTVTPVMRDRLAQLQLNQELCLLKLHGDIGKEAVSIDDLVFTGEQYKEHYAEGSPLVSILAQRFSSRRMLFLGCSLSSDRTMKVLEQVVKTQKGIRHFAILGCKKSEISTKMKELQALGILPIFYDDSNHNAVRVILERLLEETDKTGYKRLSRSCRSVISTAEEKRPLMFDSGYFPFSGREEELNRLSEFCEAEDPLLWWAVTGPGGMGKSRLVFEFCNRMKKAGWKTQRFEASPSRGGEARSLSELPGWIPEVDRTIVVLDDVQAYMESVCAWMALMDRTPRSEDLRILLLERDGTNLSDSAWLGPDFKGKYLDEWCHDRGFLRLKPMTDEQLMAVMTNYAKAAGKDLNAELLLKTLERVDPEFKRPLYAVAIADARCQGKDPTNWDRDKILDTLLVRELDFHLNRLQGIFDRKIKLSKTLQSQMELLLANACLDGILPLDQVDWSQYDILERLMTEANMKPAEFCHRLGILATAQLRSLETDQDGNPVAGSVLEAELKVIALNCPDLLKEHLVLKLAFEKKTLELLPDGWHLDPARLLFLRRLWVNYPDRLKDQIAFWDRFFSAPTTSALPAWLYADLLWGCTDVFPFLAQRAVNSLAELFNANNGDDMIIKVYAMAMVNLSNTQAPDARATTATRLGVLYNDHSDNVEIAIAYANCLLYLSIVQSPEKHVDTIDKLATLYYAHSNIDAVAVPYARALVCLSAEQSLEDCSATLFQLEVLYNSHSANGEIAVEYAKGLYNLVYHESPENRAATVQQLETLYIKHSQRAESFIEIAVIYSKSLYILLRDQPLSEQINTMRHLKAVYDAHSSEADIAIPYADGLACLSNTQPPEDLVTTLEQLNKLYCDYPNQVDIAEAYAKSMFNSAFCLTEEGRIALVHNLNILYNTHAERSSFAQYYSGVLAALSFTQTTPEGIQDTLSKNKSILKKHTAFPAVQICHAQIWFNLTLAQDESDISNTVSSIVAFLLEYPAAIPSLKETLNSYLSEHPDHTARYQPLLELGGDDHA